MIGPRKRKIDRPPKILIKTGRNGPGFWDSPRLHISHIVVALFAGLVGSILAVFLPGYFAQHMNEGLNRPRPAQLLQPVVFFAPLLVLLTLVLGTFIRTLREKIEIGVKLTWTCAKLLLALSLVFLTILIINRLSEKTEGVSILAFDNDTGESKYNGDAVAGSLKIELLRIEQILSTSHKDIGSEGSERIRPTAILESGEKLNENLKDIGTVGTEEAKLSIGALLVAAKSLWPFGDPGIVISGSIQKFGKQMRLVAFLQHQHKVQGFEDTTELQSDDAIPMLIRNLAYKIAKSLGDPAQPISAKTLEAFQNYTEGLNCYDNFITTGDIAQLRQAKSFCMTAVRAEQGYDKIVPLLKNLGAYFYQRSELKESVDLFEQATILHSLDIEAWNYLGYAWAGRGELGAAERALEKAKDLSADSDQGKLDYYLNSGYALSVVNRYSDAAVQFHKAINLSTANASGHVGLGDCLLMEGDHAGARVEYETALEQDGSSVDANLRVGDMDYEDGHYDVALASYNQALKIDNRSTNALCEIGNLYAARRDYDLAMRYYGEAVAISPQNSLPHIGLGDCLFAKGEYQNAFQELQQAAEIDPRNPSTHESLADFYYSRSQYETAMKEYQRSIELRPNFIDPYLAIADLYRLKGEYSDAEAACLEALELWYDCPNTHCALAKLFLEQDQPNRALDECEKAIVSRSDRSDGYVGKGDVFEHEADGQHALEEYAFALARQPNDYDAHCGKADVLQDLCKFTQAAVEYKRAIDILPGVARAYIGLAYNYYAQGRYELAQEEYEHAKDIAPADPDVNAGLADIAERHDNYEKARAGYTAAITSEPRHPNAWIELTWLSLRDRAFANANSYLKQQMEYHPRSSGGGLAAGAISYLRGDRRDAERIWRTKLNECRFAFVNEKVDRIILLYAVGDEQKARDTLKEILAKSEESPIGTFNDALYYVDILSGSDSHRFSALREMLLSASKPAVSQ